MENDRASKLLEEASTCALYKMVVFQKATDLLKKRGYSADIQSLGKIVDEVLNIDLLRYLLTASKEGQEAKTGKVVEDIVLQYQKSKLTG